MEATVSMGDHAMTNLTTKPDSLQRAAEMAVDHFSTIGSTRLRPRCGLSAPRMPSSGCTKRWIKTQTVLPSADTAAMLFWALLASGQINMRKVDGWQTLATKPIDQPMDSQPETIPSCYRRSRHTEFQQHPGRHRPASRRVVISRAGTTQQQSQPCQA
jgi:hypothetical protein